MTKALVFGGSGRVGTALLRALDEYVAPSHTEFDVERASHDEISGLIGDSGAQMVVNCAAFTSVDQAESDEGRAYALNAHAVGRMAEVTETLGVVFVTFSTDYVFDGETEVAYVESDVPGPINAYGRSKLAGEVLTRDSNARALVVRTSWVVSTDHRSSAAQIVEAIRRGETVRVVDDQFGSPTLPDDLAAATVSAVRAGVSGILHIANQGEASRYELARAVVESVGLDPKNVVPCSSGEYPTDAPRPRYTVLESARLKDLGMGLLPEWSESLKRL